MTDKLFAVSNEELLEVLTTIEREPWNGELFQALNAIEHERWADWLRGLVR